MFNRNDTWSLVYMCVFHEPSRREWRDNDSKSQLQLRIKGSPVHYRRSIDFTSPSNKIKEKTMKVGRVHCNLFINLLLFGLFKLFCNKSRQGRWCQYRHWKHRDDVIVYYMLRRVLLSIDRGFQRIKIRVIWIPCTKCMRVLKFCSCMI